MATNAPQDDWHKTGLRLPRELHQHLHQAATDSGRSYNGEIVARLESSFEPAAQSEDVRIALLLKDNLIGELMRDGIALRHRLLHLAFLIGRLGRVTDPSLLPGRYEDLSESARQDATNYSDLTARAGMTPELVDEWHQAWNYVERELARTRASFAADPDKLLELLDRVGRPTLEDLEKIRREEPSHAGKKPPSKAVRTSATPRGKAK